MGIYKGKKKVKKNTLSIKKKKNKIQEKKTLTTKKKRTFDQVSFMNSHLSAPTSDMELGGRGEGGGLKPLRSTFFYVHVLRYL